MAVKILGADGDTLVIFHGGNGGRIFALIGEGSGNSAVGGSLSVGAQNFSSLFDFRIQSSVVGIGVRVPSTVGAVVICPAVAIRQVAYFVAEQEFENVGKAICVCQIIDTSDVTKDFLIMFV